MFQIGLGAPHNHSKMQRLRGLSLSLRTQGTLNKLWKLATGRGPSQTALQEQASM